jgi:hypothetical protein
MDCRTGQTGHDRQRTRGDLQRSDDELVHHGIESGTIRRLPNGEFVEETVPLPAVYRVALTGVESDRPQLEGATDHGAEGKPKGPGYGDQHVVENAPERVPGFFRAKRRSGPSDTSAPVLRAPMPELERSGKPAPPEQWTRMPTRPPSPSWRRGSRRVRG